MAPAHAQLMTPAVPGNGPPGDNGPAEVEPAGPIAGPGDAIDFEADELRYDERANVVTAFGKVSLVRAGYSLKADRIEYDRTSGRITAIGDVNMIDPAGNQALGDRIELTDSLRDGAIANLLLVLNDGGRLAAAQGQRTDSIYTLNRAVYSPCAVVDPSGCPKDPVWRIKAVRVSYNRLKHRISYRNASLEMFGIPILYLPSFSHPDGEAKQVNGLLVPGIEIQRQLGLGVSLPFHLAIAPDRDVTLTPWVYTATNPALAFQARRLLRDGPIQVDGMFTYAQRVDFSADGLTEINQGDRFRGYIGIKGRLQHTPEWRSSFSLRLTTDDTFNRRYGLGFDDVLRSTYALERIGPESWLSISAWAFQGLRSVDRGGEIPFVLPLFDWDWRPQNDIIGGRVRFGASSMNLLRTGGQDVVRLSSFGRWDRRVITPMGQRLTATALVRADGYNVANSALATLPEYAGRDGLHARAIAVAAFEADWAFSGPALGGQQTITPRAQLVLSPSIRNGGFPNEDSRAIELEDISLFDLNRFPGQDRFESGSRLTYGLEYALDRPGWQVHAEIGQSVRLSGNGNEFPAGTGLNGRLSDIVGRTTLKIGSLFEFTHRFRLDKDNFAVRRNEIDIAIGGRRTYATIGYVRLNRNVTLEDLEDRQELRVGGRIAFARYWSASGTAIFDLTTTQDNPLSTANGFASIRHRIGIEYEDECFRIGAGWRRDYVGDRDFRPGNNFQITLTFKTLGR
ncbi:LPS assembly protein LptD [Sandarakinorhabdus sp.]|uniref:LPS-assembly protein LptD n=1 Tax=Sandarakinorhabdus sp. TaxID=1916663 RepID=UPI00286DD439|nr:LPS assembly protein LptD [Sandarakinorhabdus sp.]